MTTLPALLAAALLLATTNGMAQTPAPVPAPLDAQAAPLRCGATPQAVNEAGYVAIGGIAQWVTIKGASCANPVILVVHGGPGNPLSPYADALYGAWQKDYTLVQWDQRGAGRTYGKNRPAEDQALTATQLRDDGLALAAFLSGHLGQRKLILMGGSWGSYLAVSMAKARPELFHAYLGAAQLVNSTENMRTSREALLALARGAGDSASVAKLEALGAPPWRDPRSFGVLRRIDREYEALVTEPAPAAWWQRAADYRLAQDLADDEAGEDYSYLQFVGRNGDGMFAQVDLAALGGDFALPFFIVHGAEDLLTTPAVARRYFDSIRAPQKQFVLLPRSGHDPNQALLDAQLKLLNERIRPLTK
ncbi:alpha/beta fold hydrolase [Rugamonas sp. CCM 8940]|uniref:alpha/beta fold hydrolase n=1 Tax=Rugamonas sp. CCM 8940 TaxID=2765359 RepID=UPI0018F36FF2|nr:alpha/beta fold hydrolase [Rugamonas sp. CCM 8940]MBJ7312932.1 alpha/beta fold hydrolase [Rugamonas sp. CCM 8940]